MGAKNSGVLEFLKNLRDNAPDDTVSTVKLEGYEHIQIVILPPNKSNPQKTVGIKIVGSGFKGVIVRDTVTAHKIIKELSDEKIQKIVDTLNNINNISNNNKSNSKAVKLNF